MDKPLQGKVALVTGGSRGIGAAIALRLAADGAAVALTCSSSKSRAEDVVALIRSRGGKGLALAADSADADALTRAVADTARNFGRLDILVNNAGIGAFKPIQEITLEEYDRLMAINARAVFVACREAVRCMSGNSVQSSPGGASGRIITIGSTLGERAGFPGSSIYSMSKAAVVGFSRGLARDLGPLGITVNVVEPGPIDTELNPADGPGADNQIAMLAIPRYGRAEEVASMVAHLAGPECGFVTGASILVDGGFAA